MALQILAVLTSREKTVGSGRGQIFTTKLPRNNKSWWYRRHHSPSGQLRPLLLHRTQNEPRITMIGTGRVVGAQHVHPSKFLDGNNRNTMVCLCQNTMGPSSKCTFCSVRLRTAFLIPSPHTRKHGSRRTTSQTTETGCREPQKPTREKIKRVRKSRRCHADRKYSSR